MFSPTVSAPLTWCSGSPAGVSASYWAISALDAALELGAVLRLPPVGEVAVAVVLAALVVEAVPDLVPDHRADPAVVRGVVGLGVEERRLQDRGREHDLVHARVVVGVDRLRGHQPLVAVDRLADLGQLLVRLPLARPQHVAEQVVGLHVQRRVVLPRVRVADLGRELGELRQRPLPGRRAHPVERRDALPVRLDEVRDEGDHPLLGRRGEVPLDVELADRLAERALHQRHAALPPLAQLRRARQGAAVEGEVLLHHGVVQVVGAGRRRADREPRLPLRERTVGPQGGRRGDEAGLAHDDLGERAVRGLQRREPGLPVEAGRVRLQRRQRHERVGLLGVTVGDPVPGGGRQRRLQLHDLLGELLRVGRARPARRAGRGARRTRCGSRRTRRRGSTTRPAGPARTGSGAPGSGWSSSRPC